MSLFRAGNGRMQASAPEGTACCSEQERVCERVRRMEFKMERPGLLSAGQEVTVTEGELPSNYYYTIDPALAMSANIPFRNRLRSKKGVVTAVIENARGFYVTAEFDEPEAEG